MPAENAREEAPVAISSVHLYTYFEVILGKRRRKWIWMVRLRNGAPIMAGSEASRLEASYKAHSALFLLLLSSPSRAYQHRGGPGQAARARRSGSLDAHARARRTRDA